MMRKLFSILLVVFTILSFNFEIKASVASTGVPYKTYTDVNSELKETKVAYLPLGIMETEAKLNAPEDIFIYDDQLYIANTMGKNVVVLDKNGNLIKLIGDGYLSAPKSVFVNDNYVYVADNGLSKIVIFDKDDNIVKEMSKPQEALYGDTTPFNPEKLVVDKRGNIYITGSESLNGVIELNNKGNFLGFFGVNRTAFDFRMIFTNLMKIGSLIASNLPPAPTNLAIDDKGIIYTLTITANPSIRKINLAGKVMLSLNPYRVDEQVLDICLDKYNNIFVTTTKGTIYEFDEYGHLLFTFGGLDTGDNRLGLLSNPVGITVDEDNKLYVVDKDYSQIQVYTPTSFATLLHNAINYYSNGDLENSQKLFEDIKKMNQSFTLANDNLGHIYFKQDRFNDALECYFIAKDKVGYSNAFWEVRNNWLSENAEWIIIVLLVLITLNISMAIINRFKPLRNKNKLFKKLLKIKTIKELSYIGKMIKNPVNTFYDLKKNNVASMKTASIIYFALFIILLSSNYITSFIYQKVDINNISLLAEMGKYFGVLILFIVANYLISTLFDGEGTFKNIYITTAFSLAPLVIGIIPIAILTNVLTYNESFIISFLNIVMYGYTIILFLLMIKNVENLTIFGMIKNVILTIITMILIALIALICYLLFDQLFDFLISVIKEAIARASV